MTEGRGVNKKGAPQRFNSSPQFFNLLPEFLELFRHGARLIGETRNLLLELFHRAALLFREIGNLLHELLKYSNGRVLLLLVLLLLLQRLRPARVSGKSRIPGAAAGGRLFTFTGRCAAAGGRRVRRGPFTFTGCIPPRAVAQL